ELKLEVVGPGLLEKMDDPVFYTHPDLESFDTRSEIQEVAANRSRKVIEYTYLPRGQMKIAARTLKLSVFLPDQKSYKTYDIQIPELVVVGGVAAPSQPSSPSEETTTTNVVAPKITVTVPITPVSPFGILNSRVLQFSYMQIALAISAIILLLSVFTNLSIARDSNRMAVWHIYKKHVAKGVDYKGLLHFLMAIYPNTKSDLEQTLQESDLPNDVKNYFVQLIQELRRSTYAAGGSSRKIKPQSRMFKKLVKSTM